MEVIEIWVPKEKSVLFRKQDRLTTGKRWVEKNLGEGKFEENVLLYHEAKAQGW